jgi:hypothetical protein
MYNTALSVAISQLSLDVRLAIFDANCWFSRQVVGMYSMLASNSFEGFRTQSEDSSFVLSKALRLARQLDYGPWPWLRSLVHGQADAPNVGDKPGLFKL